MRFFVTYWTYRYDGPGEKVFDTIEQVLAFLNQHAGNPDFTFKVIEGREVEFEPIELVKAYKRKG